MKAHHRKKLAQGMSHTIIALLGLILALMVFRAHYVSVYMEESAQLLETRFAPSP